MIYQYRCEKCGHECGREHGNDAMICMMPAPPFGHFICGGTMRRINQAPTMAEKYPAYYKDVSELSEVDVYMVHYLFRIDDPSGCLQHADKKILLSGVRTGGKPKRKDIQEAYDTLGRYLEIHPEVEEIS